jgi:hypothetical protein
MLHVTRRGGAAPPLTSRTDIIVLMALLLLLLLLLLLAAFCRTCCQRLGLTVIRTWMFNDGLPKARAR